AALYCVTVRNKIAEGASGLGASVTTTGHYASCCDAYLRTRHPPNVPGPEFVAVAALCRWPANSDFSPNPSSSQEVLISWACIAPYDRSGSLSACKLPANFYGCQAPYGFAFLP